MKYFLLSVLFSTLCLAGFSQTKNTQSLEAAVEQLRTAMISGEKTALENIAAEQLTYGHSSGLVQNKAEFVEAIASGKSDFVTIDLTEQTAVVVNNTGIVRHILSATTNDSGKPGTVKLKILLVWTKEKGKWLLLARQAVKIP